MNTQPSFPRRDDIARALMHLDAQALRNVLVQICRLAVAGAALNDPECDRVLGFLEDPSIQDPLLLESVVSFASALEEQYQAMLERRDTMGFMTRHLPHAEGEMHERAVRRAAAGEVLLLSLTAQTAADVAAVWVEAFAAVADKDELLALIKGIADHA